MATPPAAEALATFTRLGLAESEAKLYLALVGRPAATPTELAQIAGIPRPSVYTVAGALKARGLLEEVPGRYKRFVAVPPDAAVTRLLEARRQALEAESRAGLAVAEALLPVFLAGRREGDLSTYVETFKDPRQGALRLLRLLRNAKGSVEGMMRAPYLASTAEFLQALPPERSLHLRLIAEDSPFPRADAPDRAQVAQLVAGMGGEARFREALPLSFVIIDGKAVFMTLADPAQPKDPAVATPLLVRHPDVAAVLAAAFDHFWKLSEPMTLAVAVAPKTQE